MDGVLEIVSLNFIGKIKVGDVIAPTLIYKINIIDEDNIWKIKIQKFF